MYSTSTMAKMNARAEETARERKRRKEREAISAVAVDDLFKDLDKREMGTRILRVTKVMQTPNGPGAAFCTVVKTGKKVVVRLDRLVTPYLFKKLLGE